MRASPAALALVVLAAAAPVAAGPVPMQVSIQGRLTDSGAAVTGTLGLTFAIYAQPTGGLAYRSETQQVTVTKGLFTAVLGDATPLTSDLFDGPRWVGVTPPVGAELQPRIRLTATPYAVKAQSAFTLDGLAVAVQELNQLTGMSPSVTGANLSAVTGGSSADGLHTHPNLASGISDLQAEVTTLQSDTASLATGKVSKAGDTMSGLLVAQAGVRYGDGITQAKAPAVTYTRWGRTSCGAGAQPVYTGYAATAHYAHSGSGHNTLCLTDSPTWGDHNDGNQQGALIYGMEYETSGFGLSTLAGLQNYDARCTVCLRTPATVSVMVPGTQVCPSGLTLEYAGYLMATHYTQGSGEFVCVDQAPESAGSPVSNDGGLWYPTEAECGSLPCLPYIQDREVTCAVCTR